MSTRRLNHASLSPVESGFRFLKFVAVLSSLSAPFALAGQSSENVPTQLARELDDALNERSVGCEKHLQLVENLDQHLGRQSKPSETWIKTRFVEALANMRLNRMDLSQKQVIALSEKVPQEDFPELWFRCRSLESALLMFQGEREASLELLKEILDTDTTRVSPKFVLRARTNFAAVLNELGRVNEAARRYEDVMLFAIENQFDLAAMHSGHNLISILFDQGDNLSAQHVLESLRPTAERNASTQPARWLQLHDLRLQAMQGGHQSAITEIKAILNAEDKLPAPFAGAAHNVLSVAYCEAGATAEALVHARESLELVGDRANQQTQARTTLAQALVLKGDFEEALSELAQIDSENVLVPYRRRAIDQLLLEARLRKAGLSEEADLLISLLKTDDAHVAQVLRTRSDYFEARLDAAQRKFQLREEQARTHEAVLAKNAERNYRYLLLGCVAVFAVASYLVVYLYFRHRSARLLFNEQQALTEELTEVIRSRTQELKANLQARARMEQALERKKRIEAIGLLAGNVAHDINNLLQVVSNTNEGLASPDATNQDREKMLNLSNESLRHGAGIIRNLLAFSRQQELTADPLAVVEYLRSTKPLFLAAVGERVELNFNTSDDHVHILVDASQLTTSLLNILSNAVDAMPTGGTIEFETQVVVIDVVTPESSTVPGRYFRVTITDTGCGMSDDEISRVLEPFYSTKDAESGTGLGLSSAFGFVKQSHGDLRIESQPGIGTRVTILLPVVEAPSASTPRPAIQNSRPLTPQRVLLVEDHDAVAVTLITVMRHLKFEAVRTCSGEEAKRLLSKDKAFDFILSDVNMPGEMDGLALARWVDQQFPETPIFLMSGYSEQLVGQSEWPLIQKPFNVAGLTTFLEENLEAMPL